MIDFKRGSSSAQGALGHSDESPPRAYPTHAYPPIAAPSPAAVPRARSPQTPYYPLRVSDDVHEAGKVATVTVAELELDVEARGALRTPSPTPSEARVVAGRTHVIDWRRLLNLRRYANKRGILTIAAVVSALAFIILFLVYQKRIENWLRPFANWVHGTKFGWLIPIGVLFVLSFPPLFGHGIVAILCGDVWGVWIGFGIVCAGTLLGELANYYVFKYWCTARARRIEERRLTYAIYAQVVRDGGIIVPTVMRLTFIPAHLLTAIFSTCGMNMWSFLVAAVLSLPKQLTTVYIGSAQSDGESTPTTSAIKAVVILATVAMTVVAMRYVNKRVDEVKGSVVYARRKARQERMLRAAAVVPELVYSPEPRTEMAALDKSSTTLPDTRTSEDPEDDRPVSYELPGAEARHCPARPSRQSEASRVYERRSSAFSGTSGDVEVVDMRARESTVGVRPRRHGEDVDAAVCEGRVE